MHQYTATPPHQWLCALELTNTQLFVLQPGPHSKGSTVRNPAVLSFIIYTTQAVQIAFTTDNSRKKIEHD